MARRGMVWLLMGAAGVVPAVSPSSVGLDGSEWIIIEGVRNGQYHVVARDSPEGQDPVRVMGISALKLARLSIRIGEVY